MNRDIRDIGAVVVVAGPIYHSGGSYVWKDDEVMPIYEYACKACDQKFEKLVRSMSSSEKVDCPSCGSRDTARTLSVFAVSAADGGKPSNVGAARGMCGRCGGPGPCAMG